MSAARKRRILAKAKKRHEEMGFFDGWGTVFRQLDELAQTLD